MLMQWDESVLITRLQLFIKISVSVNTSKEIESNNHSIINNYYTLGILRIRLTNKFLYPISL